MSPHRASLALTAVLTTAGLAACSPGAGAPPAVALAPVAAPPRGSGCGPAIARTQAVVESDVATGNLNKPVGDRFNADLARAAEACAAGREGEGASLLAAAKVRYGYP